MLTLLDTFAGIGGFSLAAHRTGRIKTTQFVEIEPFCQKVLSKNFPNIPIHDDIRTFTGSPGQFDIVSGGFPCQDISSSNSNGRGLEGKRSGLFFELMRVVSDVRPRYIVLENVSAMLTKFEGSVMGTVLKTLSESGYDAEWQTISASSVGAPHQRKRVFIIAYPSSIRSKRPYQTKNSDKVKKNEIKEATQCLSLYRRLSKPLSLREFNEVPFGLDRIKALGNAIVPDCGQIAFERILQIESSLS